MPDVVLEWLLEVENPSVRYFALTSLLDVSLNDPIVIQAKADIMRNGIVPKILSKQNADGSWGDPDRFYLDTYRGTVWTLLILTELACDPQHPQIKKACEFLLEHSQIQETGGFSYVGNELTHLPMHSGVVPCLSGNMVYALIKLGYLDDIRVQRGIDWIVEFQRTDDGDQPRPRGKMYDKHQNCWGKHSCHMGVAKALKALSQIPNAVISDEQKAKRDQFIEYFLLHHIYKKSHNTDEIGCPSWLKFGFPQMYQTDILELTEIMADLHVEDVRLRDALHVIRDKQNPDGTWNLDHSFNGRMVVTIEKKGFPSKWITLKALKTLKAYREL